MSETAIGGKPRPPEGLPRSPSKPAFLPSSVSLRALRGEPLLPLPCLATSLSRCLAVSLIPVPRTIAMDRDRFSFIAHALIDLANPISWPTLARACDIAGATAGTRILDVGCGKAELLIRLAEERACDGVGVERSRLVYAEAMRRVAARAPAHIRVHLADAREFIASLQPASFNLTTCIGSSHALGDARATLATFKKLTRPGGHIILGEGYWKKPPSAQYLKDLGAEESEMTTHAGNVELGTSLGLVPSWATTATDQQWDEYEWSYSRGIEDFVRDHPTDPDAAQMLERSRAWRQTFLNHGRDTLGFGVYVFRVE